MTENQYFIKIRNLIKQLDLMRFGDIKASEKEIQTLETELSQTQAEYIHLYGRCKWNIPSLED